jgi:hypothetical protein
VKSEIIRISGSVRQSEMRTKQSENESEKSSYGPAIEEKLLVVVLGSSRHFSLQLFCEGI